MAQINKAKKGTPEYEEWLRKYREKRGQSVEQEDPKKIRTKKQEQKPVQGTLFKPEETIQHPAEILPKGTVRSVYSKSQKKDLRVEVIRYMPSNGKYLVTRQDGKFLYYAPSELKEYKELVSEAPAAMKQGDSVAVVPAGSLSEKIEKNLAPAIADLNYEGMQIDKAEVDTLTKEHEALRDKAQIEINKIAGRTVNVNNPRELAQILYEEQGFPRINGSSTSAETLEELAEMGRSELPSLIIEWRKNSKLLTSYLYKLKDLADKGDGKLYNMFDTAALSGRFTTKHNPIAVEVPDSVKTEKKIYFPEDLEDIGLGAICPL